MKAGTAQRPGWPSVGPVSARLTQFNSSSVRSVFACCGTAVISIAGFVLTVYFSAGVGPLMGS